MKLHWPKHMSYNLMSYLFKNLGGRGIQSLTLTSIAIDPWSLTMLDHELLHIHENAAHKLMQLNNFSLSQLAIIVRYLSME